MFTEPKIAPSILSADFMNMARDVAEIEEGGAAFVHVDVMDGHFVPNLTLGSAVCRRLEEDHEAAARRALDDFQPARTASLVSGAYAPTSSRCMPRRSTPMPASLIWQSI